MRLTWAPSLALAILACAPVHAATIDANAIFIGGVSGTYQITFTSTFVGATLTGVDYDLSTGVGGGPGLGLFLDPTGAAPGYLTNLNLTSLGGAAATGFLGGSGISDGSTAFSLGFNDFTSGEAYSFQLDVDHYVVLNNCTGLTGAPRVACIAQNVGITLNGSIVTADEFVGTGITFHFLTSEGTKSISAKFTQPGQIGASAHATFETPEPASVVLTASGLGLLFWRNRRRPARLHLSRLR
ncbi:MAG: PEP-CTERM sorting domain-containing protein [Acidobacteriota bacterium]